MNEIERMVADHTERVLTEIAEIRTMMRRMRVQLEAIDAKLGAARVQEREGDDYNPAWTHGE